MKKKEPEYSPKEIVRDLISMQNFLPSFLNIDKDYKDVVQYFLTPDLNNENTPYPTIKELQEKLGIKYALLRRKLIQLYEDILNHENLGIEFSIKKIEYVFYLEYFDRRAYLTINDLPIIPRVGEQIWFPFPDDDGHLLCSLGPVL